MAQTIIEFLNSSRRNRVIRRRITAAAVALSVLVAFYVSWTLHLIGETASAVTYCSLEEHTHSEESGCYQTQSVLNCIEEHEHTSSCYTTERVLTCQKTEHTHTLSCYSNPEADVETASVWESAFANIELTGVYAEDLVTIAKTQLGYAESESNYAVAVNESGAEYISGNYTRYGDWYGEPYAADWGGMFISFCLNYADVPEIAFPRESGAQSWVETLSDPEQGFELYKEAGSYSPYPGDLVFFDDDEDGLADRAGIVSALCPEYTGSENYYEDDPAYTLTGFKAIEGNCAGKTAENEYTLAQNESILGYGALSLVNPVSAQILEIEYPTTAVPSFRLWVWSALSGGTTVVDCGENSEITDVLTYTDADSAVWYLIPITYFTGVAESLPGFSFDPTSPGDSPFVYAPNAAASTANLTPAEYVYSGGSWYVRVQDTGTYGSPPRSNIYYTPNSFTLTYGNYTVTFNIVDSTGNPIYGDYSEYNKAADGSARYIFGDPSESSLTEEETGTYGIHYNFAPEIGGYTYTSAYLVDKKATVYSVGLQGYQNDATSTASAITLFRFYNSEPPASGGFYTIDNASCTVNLIYTQSNSFTLTYSGYTVKFNLVDTAGSPIYGDYSEYNIEADDGNCRYIFGGAGASSLAEKEAGATIYSNIIPQIEGYNYIFAQGSDINNGASANVFSVGLTGYSDVTEDGVTSAFRFYATEPPSSGNYFSKDEDITITLTYSRSAFTLSNGQHIVTFNIVDSAGSPIYGDYSKYNITNTAGSTRYIFEDASASSLAEIDAGANIQQNIIPQIEGYNFTSAKSSDMDNVKLYSVALKGYSGVTTDEFRFYTTEPPSSGNFYSRSVNVTVTLTYTKEMTPITDIAAANSTVVNLFDYWLTTQDATDYRQTDNSAGINEDHTLKFHYSTTDAVGTANKWTGTNGGVLQNIVQSTLKNGFPALSGYIPPFLEDTSCTGESLSYLFDPTVENDYKASYKNVQGLFQTDSLGYLYYNCKENFAHYNQTTNRFELYEEAGCANYDANGNGMFFPFNTIDEAYPLNGGDQSVLNHFFGIAMTTRFLQTYEGHTNQSHQVENTFDFSGDDDVWIFIDDVLVADLGGIHDEASVNINFADGTVTISRVYESTGSQSDVTTYFSDIFANTDVKLATYTEDGEEHITLADGTTHVLKFFYLERGAAASNLFLKFNLTDVPNTSLYKVDQYGEAVSGAGFGVYRAQALGEDYIGVENDASSSASSSQEYGYIADDGSVISLKYLDEAQSAAEAASTTNTCYTDPNTGVITANINGTVYTVTPAYVNETDANGQMVFEDADQMSYSPTEIQAMFGDYFYLREIKVPDGYRSVSDDTLLYFENELMQCYDPYATGVWADPNALITAPTTIYIADNYGNDDLGAQDTGITFYDPAAGEVKGTLFAVILKRNLDTSTTINADTVTSWVPVYGNDVDGYYSVPFGEGEEYSTQLAAVLAAAKLETAGSNIFTAQADGMQLMFEDLPGEATRYYTYMKNHEIPFTETDPQYLIAYYYTTAETLDGADVSNTVRIRSHGGTATDGTQYNAFYLQWGATIEVPNTIDALYFQKADAAGNLLNNASFALYSAAESSGTGYYIGADNDGAAVYIRLDETIDAQGNVTSSDGKAVVYTSLPSSNNSTGGVAGTYTINTEFTLPTENITSPYITEENAGVITVSAGNRVYTITPDLNAQGQSLVGFTHNTCAYANESGTGHFHYINNGSYFLKEIACPKGYDVNYTNIPVEVTEEGVYASAGAVDNDVRVGNGVGFLVKTMDVFASLGEIDETLAWVYTHLKVQAYDGKDFIDNLDNTFYVHSIYTDNYLFTGYGKSNGESSGDPEYIPEGALTNGTKDNLLLLSTLPSYASIPTADYGCMRQYLRYEGKLTDSVDENKVFDYALYGREDGVNSYRLWTESGWSDLAIYQDYEYGYIQATTNYTTAYKDLTSYGEISYLFSSSTFVQVTDQYSYGNLEISKTVVPSSSSLFNFTLTLTSVNAESIIPIAGDYTYTVYNVASDGTRTAAQTGTLTISEDSSGVSSASFDFTLTDAQVLVIENLPYGVSYSVTESLGTDLPYLTYVSTNGGESEQTVTNAGKLLWRTDAGLEENVYNIDYTNALNPLVQILKIDALSNAALANAEFVMYRTVTIEGASVTQYYNSDGTWSELNANESESDRALGTAANGELLFANMDTDGTYILKEVAAPPGYQKPTDSSFITFTVENGNITSPTTSTDPSFYTVVKFAETGQEVKLKIKNTSGYELPKTGGTGTARLRLWGALLAGVGLISPIIYKKAKKRRRKT